jgi:undecaprenol kinase
MSRRPPAAADPSPQKNQPFPVRLGHALRGLKDALARERSLRTHALLALVAGVGLAVTHAPPVWWALGALAVAGVLAAELFNTALEALADRLHPERHPEIRFAKDVAAAAVAVAALGAVGVALAWLWTWLTR